MTIWTEVVDLIQELHVRAGEYREKASLTSAHVMKDAYNEEADNFERYLKLISALYEYKVVETAAWDEVCDYVRRGSKDQAIQEIIDYVGYVDEP